MDLEVAGPDSHGWEELVSRARVRARVRVQVWVRDSLAVPCGETHRIRVRVRGTLWVR